jgi:hypothetical protein
MLAGWASDQAQGEPGSYSLAAVKAALGGLGAGASHSQKLSSFSDHPAGIFTGHHHTKFGTPFTVGNGTFFNVFDPNPEPTCDLGTFGPDTNCQPCPANRYCPGGQMNVECAPHAISFALSFRKTQCTCEPGYFGPNGGPCAICPADSWCPGGIKKFECPAHSSSGEGQIQCTCDPGFKGPDHDHCEVCGEGKFCLGGNHAQQCTANSWSGPGAPGAQSCGCSKGWYEVSRTNPANGPDCGVCPANSYCAGGVPGATPAACPANTAAPAGSGALSDCQCVAGYFGTASGGCQRCPLGLYCPGGDKTVACPSGTKSTSIGAASVDQCLCLPGTYGQASSGCQSCPAGYFCRGGSERPYECNHYMTSNVGASECFCMPGYTGDSRGCSYCSAGQYCPGGTAKVPCPPNSEDSFGASSADQCICKAGFTGSGGYDCHTCPSGKFCPTAGEAPRSCPQNSEGAAGLDGAYKCTCQAGFYNVRNTFQMNHFVGPECVPCPAGSYCPAGGGQPVSCPARMTAQAGAKSSNDCTAAPGYLITGLGLLEICPAGMFCVGGSVGAQNCPGNSYSQAGATSRSDCKCNPGFFGNDPRSCQSCPANAVCIGGDSIEMCAANARPNSDATACECVAGFFGNNPKYCRQCTSNSYCVGGGSRTQCQAGASSQPGSSRQEDCVCNAGYMYENGACVTCGAGYYCPAMRPKRKCPPHKTSAPGAKTKEYCSTVAGYYDDNFMPDHDFVWRFEGEIVIKMHGYYTFCTSSDDGSLLYVKGNRLLVNDDGLHGDTQACAGLELHAGKVPIRVDGFERGGWVAEKVTYRGPDTDNRAEFPHSELDGGNGYVGWKMTIWKNPDASSKVPAIPGNLKFLGSTWVDQVDIRFASGPSTFDQYFLPTARECEPGYYCLGRSPGYRNWARRNKCINGLTTAPGLMGATSVAQCDQCAPGTYKDGISCRSCSMNKYCPGGSSAPIDCPEGSVTLGYKSASRADCVCDKGQEKVPGVTAMCRPCSLGYYCPYKDGDGRDQCPEGSTTSETGARWKGQCKCKPGFYGSSANCKVCTSGYYCTGNGGRSSCGTLANSPSGADSYNECVCDAGEQPYFQIQAFQPQCSTYRCMKRNRCAAEKLCNDDPDCLGYTARRGTLNGETCLVMRGGDGDSTCVNKRKDANDNDEWSFFKRLEFKKEEGPGNTFFAVESGTYSRVNARCGSYSGELASLHSVEDDKKAGKVCSGGCAQWRNGRCYSDKHAAATFSEALATCKNWGGTIMTIRDDHDWEIAKRFSSRYSGWWVGLQKSIKPTGHASRDWTFFDGTSNQYVMGKFGRREPQNTASKGCVFGVNRLYTVSCDTKKQFTCVKSMELSAGSGNSAPCYIGLERPNNRSPFRWKDDTGLDFTAWDIAVGEPKLDGPETKVVLTSQDGGKWHDWGTGREKFVGVCRSKRKE